MLHQGYNGGWLEIVCGCMFSGKSEELIRRLKRARIARQDVQVFYHSLDNRYGDGRIASHSGDHTDAEPVAGPAEILTRVRRNTQVVGIDEVQFFGPEIVSVIHELAGRGMRVIAAGLDMDFRGEPFGAMPLLLAEAESVTKLTAICMTCGAAATRTQRLIDGRPAYYDDPVILVGASEVYEARCRSCHQVPRRSRP